MKRVKKNILFLISSMAIISPFTILSAKCENRNDEAKNTNENENNSNNINDTNQDSNNDKNEIIPTPSPTPIPNPIPDHSNNDKDNQDSKPNPQPQPKPNSKWSEEAKKVFGLSFDKYSELANFYNLTDKLTVAKAISKITNKEENGIKISNIKINAFDESKGTLLISIDLEENGSKLPNKEINISGFEKIELFNQEFITVSLNKEKLISENKKINDINENELENYLTINGLDKSNKSLNISKLIKEYPENYFFTENGKIQFSSKKRENVNFELNIRYRKKELEKNTHETIIKKVQVIRKKINDNNITTAEILNYIINKHVKIRDNKIDFNKFPSSFLHNFRTTKKIVDLFIDNEKEDYFNNINGTRIEFANQSLEINDLEGSIKIKFSLKIEENGKEIYSVPKEFSIAGFKKITKEYLAKYFQLFFDITTEKGKKFIKDIKNEYEKRKMLDLKFIMRKLNLNNNQRTFLKLVNNWIQDSELKVHPHSIIKLEANSKNINDAIINGTQINFFNRKDDESFEIEDLSIQFKSMSFDKVRKNQIWLEYDLEITLNPESNHQQTIVIPQEVSFIF